MGEAVPRRGWRRPRSRHGCRRGAVVVDAAEAEPFALSDDGQAAAVAETAADIEARRRSTRRFTRCSLSAETSLVMLPRSCRTCSGENVRARRQKREEGSAEGRRPCR